MGLGSTALGKGIKCKFGDTEIIYGIKISLKSGLREQHYLKIAGSSGRKYIML